MSELRGLPAVDQILKTQQAAEFVAFFGRPLTLDAIREELSLVREEIKTGETLPSTAEILQRVAMRLEEWIKPSLVPVINASGVVLHTNLGRAPLSKAALQAIQNVAGGYCSLEYNLDKGARGSREIHAENLLTRLTGGESALVVNNNAAAVLLILSALANRRRVIISRSQLVEIGGGFRVPDVMVQSGAKLVEVGTTNRVHITDFQEALQEPAALVLKAHHSNFRLVGFTSEPDLAELSEVAHQAGVFLVDDLGSGVLIETTRYGLIHEPTIQESLQAGADVVCFSGDKLLGGPQAGIIVGKKPLLDRIRKHPLARAVRADKLCLAALSATLLHYLRDDYEREVPIWQMISKPADQIKARAERWRDVVGQGEIIESQSTIGGGSLPGESLATYALALKIDQPNRILAQLRKQKPPIIGRVENDRVLLDPRTVLPDQEGALLVGLQNVLGNRI